MDEQTSNYLEMFPIYRTLCQKIENEILNDANKKNIKVGNGSNLLVDKTLGKIKYSNDINNVSIVYSLLSSKYKEEIKDKLFATYEEYYDVKIIEEQVRNKTFDAIRKACDLTVVIPCDLNKIHYQKLGILEKQKLREEAINNISTGLVVFNSEDITNKR